MQNGNLSALVVGAVGPAAVGVVIDHADTVNQRPDPDEISPPGGAPLQTGSMDAGAEQPIPPFK